jgi:hypothetical protein
MFNIPVPRERSPAMIFHILSSTPTTGEQKVLGTGWAIPGHNKIIGNNLLNQICVPEFRFHDELRADMGTTSGFLPERSDRHSTHSKHAKVHSAYAEHLHHKLRGVNRPCVAEASTEAELHLKGVV